MPAPLVSRGLEVGQQCGQRSARGQNGGLEECARVLDVGQHLLIRREPFVDLVDDRADLPAVDLFEETGDPRRQFVDRGRDRDRRRRQHDVVGEHRPGFGLRG